MSLTVDVGMIVPSALATCCLAADRSGRRAAVWLPSVLMLLAMLDAATIRVVPGLLWAVVLVVTAILPVALARREQGASVPVGARGGGRGGARAGASALVGARAPVGPRAGGSVPVGARAGGSAPVGVMQLHRAIAGIVMAGMLVIGDAGAAAAGSAASATAASAGAAGPGVGHGVGHGVALDAVMLAAGVGIAVVGLVAARHAWRGPGARGGRILGSAEPLLMSLAILVMHSAHA